MICISESGNTFIIAQGNSRGTVVVRLVGNRVSIDSPKLTKNMKMPQLNINKEQTSTMLFMQALAVCSEPGGTNAHDPCSWSQRFRTNDQQQIITSIQNGGSLIANNQTTLWDF